MFGKIKQKRQQGIVTKTYAGGELRIGPTQQATAHPTAQSANPLGKANRRGVCALFKGGTTSAIPCLSLYFVSTKSSKSVINWHILTYSSCYLTDT